MTINQLLTPPAKKFITTKGYIQHSKNWYGPDHELALKHLEVMECNEEGDCMCYFRNNLADVDHRDIGTYHFTRDDH